MKHQQLFNKIDKQVNSYYDEKGIMFPNGCPVVFKKTWNDVKKKTCAKIVASHGAYYGLELDNGEYVEGIHGSYLKENF